MHVMYRVLAHDTHSYRVAIMASAKSAVTNTKEEIAHFVKKL